MHLLRIILLLLLLLLLFIYLLLIYYFFAKSQLKISFLRVRSFARPEGRCVQGKFSVIEIVGYSYGRWFFLLPFQSLNHNGRNKYKHHYLKKSRKVSNLWSKDVLILRCVMFDFRSDIWVTLRWFLKKLTPLRLQGLCD